MAYFLILASFVFLSCTNSHFAPSHDSTSSEKTNPDWDQKVQQNIQQLLSNNTLRFSAEEIQHLQWVAKASLLLRGQRELSLQDDDIAKLKSLSREQVVDLFLQSDTFYNSIIDFSLYFSGFRVDPFYIEQQYLNPRIYSHANALTAARAVAEDKSFFELLSFEHTVNYETFGNMEDFVFPSLNLPFPSLNLTSTEKRILLFDEIIKQLKSFQALPDNELNLAADKFCPSVGNFSQLSYPDNFITTYSGFPQYAGIYTSINYKPPFALTEICDTSWGPQNSSPVSKVKDTHKAQKHIAYLISFFENLATWISQQENLIIAKNIFELPVLDITTYGKTLWYTKPEISMRLSNSSTNMNRKRAAYILKHYFCDDLTPVNVQISDDHAQGAHGTNPSCYACHYKLDPMAGFFKDHGFRFNDYTKLTTIMFDDFAQADLAQYQQQWKKSDGTWNIGYIQSTQNEHLNQYGENLQDLHHILQTSPDVKRCMVKRIFEYATTPEQAFDPGFIDDNAKTYIKEENISPRQAMKNLFKRIALSKTFSAENAMANECYDLKPGVSTDSRPPCQIAHILESSCIRCHSSTTGKTPLDLSKWIVTSDGTMGFPHIDPKTGLQRPSAETFKTMLERITTSDVYDRMPPGDMNPVYRQTLFEWLSQK